MLKFIFIFVIFFCTSLFSQAIQLEWYTQCIFDELLLVGEVVEDTNSIYYSYYDVVNRNDLNSKLGYNARCFEKFNVNTSKILKGHTSSNDVFINVRRNKQMDNPSVNDVDLSMYKEKKVLIGLRLDKRATFEQKHLVYYLTGIMEFDSTFQSKLNQKLKNDSFYLELLKKGYQWDINFDTVVILDDTTSISFNEKVYNSIQNNMFEMKNRDQLSSRLVKLVRKKPKISDENVEKEEREYYMYILFSIIVLVIFVIIKWIRKKRD